MPRAPAWTPPQRFDEYRLVRELGHGGMGAVYLAEDTALGRLVAVKFISTLHADAEARQRFSLEARAAARIQHPNVVSVYRIGELSQRPYIVSEYVRGQSLDSVPKPMPWAKVLEVGLGLVRGLAAAHRKGVLHRDIKPGNAVIAEDGTVKLLDFGLARILEGAETPSGAFTAASALLSPERSCCARSRASIEPRTPIRFHLHGSRSTH